MAAIDEHPAADASADDGDEVEALARRFLALHADHTTVVHPRTVTTEAPDEPAPAAVSNGHANGHEGAMSHAGPVPAQRITSFERTTSPEIRRDRTRERPAGNAAAPVARPALNGHTTLRSTPTIDRRVASLARTAASAMRRPTPSSAAPLRVATIIARRINSLDRTKPTTLRRDFPLGTITPVRTAAAPRHPAGGADVAEPPITMPVAAAAPLPDKAMTIASFPALIYEPEFIEPELVLVEPAAPAPSVPIHEPLFIAPTTSPPPPAPAPEPVIAPEWVPPELPAEAVAVVAPAPPPPIPAPSQVPEPAPSAAVTPAPPPQVELSLASPPVAETTVAKPRPRRARDGARIRPPQPDPPIAAAVEAYESEGLHPGFRLMVEGRRSRKPGGAVSPRPTLRLRSGRRRQRAGRVAVVPPGGRARPCRGAVSTEPAVSARPGGWRTLDNGRMVSRRHGPE